jgi:hypothetical protein
MMEKRRERAPRPEMVEKATIVVSCYIPPAPSIV